jgi:L-lactate utilization protein LutC
LESHSSNGAPVETSTSFKRGRKSFVDTRSFLFYYTRDLDNYHEKIHLGITHADYGISETRTLVMDLGDDNLRLITMICEIHLCILKKSTIKKSADELYDKK